MPTRITGAVVNKGDLVTPKQLYFSFNTKFPWIPSLTGEERAYTDYEIPTGIGIVIDTLPKYDRCLDGNDCSVFWISTHRITKESSQCLKIISKSCIVNR